MQKRQTKEIPILFSTPMVQAILDSRKTKTRRIVTGKHLRMLEHIGKDDFNTRTCPKGVPGDLLWVRETFGKHHKAGYYYKADAHNTVQKSKIWKPSIHMPKEACRLWIEIISIRVEKLQDISEADAIAEGIEQWPKELEIIGGSYKWYQNPPLKRTRAGVDPKTSFFSLWESINGEGSRRLNPWVWVIEFKKTERP